MEDVKRSWNKSSMDKGVVDLLFVKAREALPDLNSLLRNFFLIINERHKSSISSL